MKCQRRGFLMGLFGGLWVPKLLADANQSVLENGMYFDLGEFRQIQTRADFVDITHFEPGGVRRRICRGIVIKLQTTQFQTFSPRTGQFGSITPSLVEQAMQEDTIYQLRGKEPAPVAKILGRLQFYSATNGAHHLQIYKMAL